MDVKVVCAVVKAVLGTAALTGIAIASEIRRHKIALKQIDTELELAATKAELKLQEIEIARLKAELDSYNCD